MSDIPDRFTYYEDEGNRCHSMEYSSQGEYVLYDDYLRDISDIKVDSNKFTQVHLERIGELKAKHKAEIEALMDKILDSLSDYTYSGKDGLLAIHEYQFIQILNEATHTKGSDYE